MERYCEHSTGTKTETEIGEEHKCINNGWTGAVMNHRYMCHSHIKRHSKVTFKARDGKKKTKKKTNEDLLPVSRDCLQQGTETQEEKVKMFVQPNDISF